MILARGAVVRHKIYEAELTLTGVSSLHGWAPVRVSNVTRPAGDRESGASKRRAEARVIARVTAGHMVAPVVSLVNRRLEKLVVQVVHAGRAHWSARWALM
jgi:hypothetical protein